VASQALWQARAAQSARAPLEGCKGGPYLPFRCVMHSGVRALSGGHLTLIFPGSCHARVFDFLAHSQDETALAPSHIIRVDPETEQVATVLYTDGEELSGSSAGAPYGYQFVVGAVFDSEVLICPRS